LHRNNLADGGEAEQWARARPLSLPSARDTAKRVADRILHPLPQMISAAQWPRPISIPQARVPAQAVPKSGPARRVLWNGSPVEPERLAHSCVGGIEPGGEIFVLEGAAEPWGILRRGRELSDCVLGARAIVQQPQVLRMLREGTIEVFQCVPVALHPVIELSAAEAELPEIRRRETASDPVRRRLGITEIGFSLEGRSSHLLSSTPRGDQRNTRRSSGAIQDRDQQLQKALCARLYGVELVPRCRDAAARAGRRIDDGELARPLLSSRDRATPGAEPVRRGRRPARSAGVLDNDGDPGRRHVVREGGEVARIDRSGRAVQILRGHQVGEIVLQLSRDALVPIQRPAVAAPSQHQAHAVDAHQQQHHEDGPAVHGVARAERLPSVRAASVVTILRCARIAGPTPGRHGSAAVRRSVLIRGTAPTPLFVARMASVNSSARLGADRGYWHAQVAVANAAQIHVERFNRRPGRRCPWEIEGGRRQREKRHGVPRPVTKPEQPRQGEYEKRAEWSVRRGYRDKRASIGGKDLLTFQAEGDF